MGAQASRAPQPGRNYPPILLKWYTYPLLALLGLYSYLKFKSEDILRDLHFILRLARGKRHLQAVATKKQYGIVDTFMQRVLEAPDALALTFLDSTDTPACYSFRQLEAKSNQVANWARSVGVRPGDVVALMMDNRPEFVWTFLGLAKIGAITAFINTSLKNRSLYHCLEIAKAKIYIIGSEHLSAASAMRDRMEGSNPEYPKLHGDWLCYGPSVTVNFSHLDPLLEQQPSELIGGLHPERRPLDTVCFIYTSGTTGLPKASLITNLRFYMTGFAFSSSFQMKPTDKTYCSLPLYHASALFLGLSCSWVVKSSVVIRSKFSASKFWVDCAKQGCTIGLYIGEICRYLMAVPPCAEDTGHKVRMMVGNGMRPDIWRPFQNRFGISTIGEFYAATEGNANMINMLGEPGAVGFVPPMMSSMYPVKIVRYDVEKDEIVRRLGGLCVEADYGEPGELIGRIDTNDPLRSYAQYQDKSATEKKILRNVFTHGDAYFRTGDLLKRDPRGFFYFVDRIGDTFRWHGENVSTSEVEEVVNRFPSIQEAVVYGVAIPGKDGKAGMASVSVALGADFDSPAFYKHVTNELPNYATPLIVRLRQTFDVTGTFKHVKTELVHQGFDPDQIKDPMYFRDDAAKAYVELTPHFYAQLCSPNSRL